MSSSSVEERYECANGRVSPTLASTVRHLVRQTLERGRKTTPNAEEEDTSRSSKSWARVPSVSSKYPCFGVFRNTLTHIMLSKRDKAVLDFERSWWLVPGPKDRAVQEHLGMSAGRYYQILRDLLDDPTAMAYDPLTIRRLLKVRAERNRRRPESRIIADGMDPADI